MEAFPFAGNAEKAYGDAAVRDAAGYRLIEFKARLRDIEAEKDKYDFPDGASSRQNSFRDLLREYHREIFDHPAHDAHWLVYGVPTTDGAGFTLKGCRYRDAGTSAIDLDQAAFTTLETMSRETLLDYLEVMEVARGSSTSRGSGGPAAQADGRLLVAGVRGDRVQALSVEEFKCLSLKQTRRTTPQAAGQNTAAPVARRPRPR